MNYIVAWILSVKKFISKSVYIHLRRSNRPPLFWSISSAEYRDRRPQGGYSQYTWRGGGGPTELHITNPRKYRAWNLTPKKYLAWKFPTQKKYWFILSNKEKNRFEICQPKKIPGVFLDPKKYRESKCSTQKKIRRTPRHVNFEYPPWAAGSLPLPWNVLGSEAFRERHEVPRQIPWKKIPWQPLDDHGLEMLNITWRFGTIESDFRRSRRAQVNVYWLENQPFCREILRNSAFQRVQTFLIYSF